MHLLDFFSANTIFITVLGYQMSYIEFFGTLFNLWSVYLVTQNNILNWPIGNVGVVLFAMVFYQVQLYSDFFLQIYFFITGLWGWYVWAFVRRKKSEGELSISYSTRKTKIMSFVFVLLGTLLLGYITTKLPVWVPHLFTKPAAFPYIDAFITIMSFAATIYMAYKKIECWYLWITVDIIAFVLYRVKGIDLISILYLIFLVLSIKGLLNWKEIYKKQN